MSRLPEPPPGFVLRDGLYVPETAVAPPVFPVQVQGFAPPPAKPKRPRR